MNLLAAELRAVAVRLRAHYNGPGRSCAAFVAFRCQRWAKAVEARDRAAIAAALETITSNNARAAYGFELEAYTDAAWILHRALDATRAA